MRARSSTGPAWPGSSASSPSGRAIASCRAALALCDAEDGVFAALGLHPHEAGAVGDPELEELRELLEHPKAVAVGETGLDYYRDHAPRDRQAWAFRAQSALAAELGKPLVVHTRAADADTVAALEALPAGRAGRPALLLLVGAARARAGARLVRLVRRERHLPEGGRAALGGRACAGRAAAGGDRLPLPGSPARAREAKRARLRRARRRDARGGPRRRRRRPGGPDRAERNRRSSRCRERPPETRARPALAGRREHPPRDRQARRRSGRTTSSSRSAPAWGC